MMIKNKAKKYILNGVAIHLKIAFSFFRVVIIGSSNPQFAVLLFPPGNSISPLREA